MVKMRLISLTSVPCCYLVDPWDCVLGKAVLLLLEQPGVIKMSFQIVTLAFAGALRLWLKPRDRICQLDPAGMGTGKKAKAGKNRKREKRKVITGQSQQDSLMSLLYIFVFEKKRKKKEKYLFLCFIITYYAFSDLRIYQQKKRPD